ncbi:SARP family transcriptional regulator [Streptomyces spinoverrucosus]|uniref:SARP family transcriptional regulator n=1 Tax=Streptomyces spinoverrucosus TaxID=284043 RepID=A0A4Y3VM81_9ACTN|nr:BTAD domain-containing putative transcriptional regulator [Streptomyces spinoverrucosus]GEC08112.1 SARP family transcriptional regulator [Streptomyces spinoverrucosus]GHB64730.1 SARP family transcriptional regulator [Streptomyces spinoverrucosus]
MRFGVLGPLAVWAADGSPVTVPGLKTRTLLAALLSHEGRPASADRLVDEVWGEGELPGNPSAALQTKVWQLRKVFEDAEPGSRELLTLRDDGYLLRVEPESVDMDRFAALTARARAADGSRARAALLSEGLALWRGAAFSGFEDAAFARPVITRLDEARLAALEALAEARIDLGEHLEVAGELHELVVRHPLRERLRALQMRALYAAGRVGEALAAYQDVRTRLADELGLDPGPELTALHQAMLEQDAGLSAPAAVPSPPRRPATNLPAPLTELVGREGAVAEVRRLLAGARHVTLTGSGGVGKTRLALETAGRLAADFPDGAWLVELAALGRTSSANAVDPVAEAVMAALGIREEAGPASGGTSGLSAPAERLAEALSGKRLLLLLDNCEHIVDAVAELAALLLKRSPGLRILATSQEPFGVLGEVVWAVPPLEVPDPAREPGLDEVARSSAVELFVARAAAAAPGFTLDAGNARDVAVICRRLDGIPLALELAATRVRTLGVRGLITRLDDRFRLLATGYRGAPPRQQTLRAMIDWSWDLLTEPERAVLRSLAVHVEGCTLEAAEAVCAAAGVAPDDVLDLLDRLVARSLVVMADSGDEPRYRLLESVADYALARLDEAGESEDVRRRHRGYYTELAEHAAPLLHGPDQRRRLRALDAEAANLRRALDDAVRRGAAEDALRLVNALSWYWFLRGRLREAGRSLEAALGAAARTGADGNQEAVASLRAQAQVWRAGFAVLVGDGTERTPDSRVAAELSRKVTDRRKRARAQWFLGFALFGVGDQAASEELIDQALDAFQALGDTWGTAAALSVRANQAHVRGDLTRLAHDGRHSARLFAELADGWGQLQTIEPLAALAEMAGDYDRAAQLHQDGLRMAEDLGLWPDAADRLTSLGSTAMLTGDHARAREFHQRAMRLAAEHSYKPGEIHAEVGIGLGARRAGQLDTAEAHMRHVLRWQSMMSFEPGRALVLAELGFIAEQRGDADQALRLHLEGWAAARNTGDARAMALALEGLAGAHALAGRHVHAAVLLGAAHAARDSVGMPLPAAERGDVDRITQTVREHLDEAAYRTAYRRGSGLTPEQAVSEYPA